MSARQVGKINLKSIKNQRLSRKASIRVPIFQVLHQVKKPEFPQDVCVSQKTLFCVCVFLSGELPMWALDSQTKWPLSCFFAGAHQMATLQTSQPLLIRRNSTSTWTASETRREVKGHTQCSCNRYFFIPPRILYSFYLFSCFRCYDFCGLAVVLFSNLFLFFYPSGPP